MKNIVSRTLKGQKVIKLKSTTPVTGPTERNLILMAQRNQHLSFFKIHEIGSYGEKSFHVTEVTVGTIKLVTDLSETVSFLKTLECLYDT